MQSARNLFLFKIRNQSAPSRFFVSGDMMMIWHTEDPNSKCSRQPTFPFSVPLFRHSSSLSLFLSLLSMLLSVETLLYCCCSIIQLLSFFKCWIYKRMKKQPPLHLSSWVFWSFNKTWPSLPLASPSLQSQLSRCALYPSLAFQASICAFK